MVTIVKFYGKPGCINNQKQIRLLQTVDVELEVIDLLKEVWTTHLLREFFGDLPKSQWVNPSAPAIKSGDITISDCTHAELMAAMCQDPLLIRRPLIECEGKKMVGFDWQGIADKLGVEFMPLNEDVETCARVQAHELNQKHDV